MQNGIEFLRGGTMRSLSSMDWRISFASTVHQLHVIMLSPAERQDGTNTLTLSTYCPRPAENAVPACLKICRYHMHCKRIFDIRHQKRNIYMT
jgi:hypothetical protein